jgi:hypothetical protein
MLGAAITAAALMVVGGSAAGANVSPEVKRECRESRPTEIETCEKEANSIEVQPSPAILACYEIETEPGPLAECLEYVKAIEKEKREEARADREIEREEIREEERFEREEARTRQRQKRLAREWRHKPTVTLPIATEFAKRAMRTSNTDVWEVDCRGGRINRTHWRCQVKVFYHCLRGRVRISGAGFKNHTPFYRWRFGNFHPCRI